MELKNFFRYYLSVVLFLLVSVTAFSKEPICFDRQNGYFIRTPKGWEVDTGVTARMGYCAVFRKESFNFYTSPAGIYVRILPFLKKTEKGELDLQKFIDEDLEPFEIRTNDRAKVREEKDFAPTPGQKFMVRLMSNGPAPNSFERIAYLGGKEAVLLVVLTVRTLEDLELYRGNFEEVLKGILPRTRGDLFQMLSQWVRVDSGAKENKNYPRTFLRLMEKELKKIGELCLSAGSRGVKGVLAVADSGKDVFFLSDEPTVAADCASFRLGSLTFPRPPYSPFYLELKLK